MYAIASEFNILGLSYGNSKHHVNQMTAAKSAVSVQQSPDSAALVVQQRLLSPRQHHGISDKAWLHILAACLACWFAILMTPCQRATQ